MPERHSPFHQELDQVQAEVVRLAAMVTETIPRATEVLLSGDMAAAQAVIEDDDRIFAAIRAGADGYFLKQTDPERLIQGIKEAMEGGASLESQSVEAICARLRAADPELSAAAPAVAEASAALAG